MNLLRKLTLVVCVMGFCILSVNTASGICPPCNDCIYEPAEWPLVVNHNGCSYYVYYSTCNGGANIRIDQLVPVSGNPYCDPQQINQWIRYAAMEALANAHWIQEEDWPANPNGYDVTLQIPACMEYDGANFVPCSTTDCCEERYTLRMIDDCPTVQYRFPPNNCVCPNPTGGCVNACDDIVFEEDECMRVDYNICSLFCSNFDYGSTIKGNYISDGGGDIEIWALHDMNNDTLCVDLGEIFYSPPNTPPNPEEAIRRAIQKTLYDLYLSEFGSGAHWIRISTPACYNQYNPDPGNYILWACNYYECCSTLYLVDDSGGNIEVTWTDHDPDPDPTCPPDPDPCSIWACQPEVWDTQPMPKSSSSNINIDNSKQGIISYVKPNPAEDQLDIIFMSEDKGTYQTKIFDVNGNEVYKFDFRKTGHEAVYQLNTSGFNSGIYTYHIMNGDIVIFSGKFMIVR